MAESSDLSRRTFIASSAASAAAGMLLSQTADADQEATTGDEMPIRIALVGCGGRGTGAAENCMQAAPGVKLVAMADLFEDRMDSSLKYLLSRKKLDVDVNEESRYLGFDAYKRVLEREDVDLVLFTTPPGFRPQHVEDAIEAGKHVFMEKPVAVDPVGVRRIIAAGEKAKEKGLAVVAGTQYRHALQWMDTIAQIHDGRIGEVVYGRAYYLTGLLWHRGTQENESEVAYQTRNWLYYDWLAGDHIVEQHIHTIDVSDWVMQSHPVRAVGMGGRLNRTDTKWGNIYDHFAIDYEYPGGKHVISVCRQMHKCHNHVSATFVGTQGWANPYWGKVEGKFPWQFKAKPPRGMYVQEHTDLVESIRANEPLNEAEQVAHTTLTAIMGREAAYTGQAVTWEQMMKSDLSLSDDVTAFGDKPVRDVPRPGMKRV